MSGGEDPGVTDTDPGRRESSVAEDESRVSREEDDGISLEAATAKSDEEHSESEGFDPSVPIITAETAAKLTYEQILERIKNAEDAELAQLNLWRSRMELWRETEKLGWLKKYQSSLAATDTKARDKVEARIRAADDNIAKLNNKYNDQLRSVAAPWDFKDPTLDSFGFNVKEPIDEDSVLKLTNDQISQRIAELESIKDKDGNPLLFDGEYNELLQLKLWRAEIEKRNLAANASEEDKKAANDKVEATKRALLDARIKPWDFSRYTPPKTPAGKTAGGDVKTNENEELVHENPFLLKSGNIFAQFFEACYRALRYIGAYPFDLAVAWPVGIIYSEVAGLGYMVLGSFMKTAAAGIGLVTSAPTLNMLAKDYFEKSEKYTGTWALLYHGLRMMGDFEPFNGYLLKRHLNNSFLGKILDILGKTFNILSLGILGMSESEGSKYARQNFYDFCAKCDNPKDPKSSWFSIRYNQALQDEKARERTSGPYNRPYSFKNLPMEQKIVWGAVTLTSPIWAPVAVVGGLSFVLINLMKGAKNAVINALIGVTNAVINAMKGAKNAVIYAFNKLKNLFSSSSADKVPSSRHEAEREGPPTLRAAAPSEAAQHASMAVRESSAENTIETTTISDTAAPTPTLSARADDESAHEIKVRADSEGNINQTNSIRDSLKQRLESVRDKFNLKELPQRLKTFASDFAGAMLSAWTSFKMKFSGDKNKMRIRASSSFDGENQLLPKVDLQNESEPQNESMRVRASSSTSTSNEGEDHNIYGEGDEEKQPEPEPPPPKKPNASSQN